ncbi:MAG: peptidoglycan DD-metalloendopeptidase family protein, partial [Xanthomonadales bacterium]|nr:peptidoglycan DD-metalloendopeptidase family protein [Xanthomonadales bacterium]
EGLASRLVPLNLVREVREASGVIRDSFFMAGRDAGLTDALIMDLAHLFGWDIDFILDIRSGDSFQVIYEEVIRDGEFVRTGDILAATFVNQGRKVQAIRFESDSGVGYFTPDGRNIKKSFLRAPLNFSYVSSSFNPRRFHPILNRVKAHNGIDYRAPSGTPVMAAGDGRVIRSSYGKYNGHHVFIEHPNGIVTKYLHFTRRAVNKGEKVSQGEVIGYVGATGLATAPHLHYEFIVNGVHRNPATVDLPKADPLPGDQLALFQEKARPYLGQLDRLAATELLATAE